MCRALAMCNHTSTDPVLGTLERYEFADWACTVLRP
jgi:hypothetical protein